MTEHLPNPQELRDVEATVEPAASQVAQETGRAGGTPFDLMVARIFELLGDPYVVGVLIIFGAVAYYFLYIAPKQPKTFKPESLKKILKDDIDDVINFVGSKIKANVWYQWKPVMLAKNVAYIYRIDNQTELDEWNTLDPKEKKIIVKQGAKPPEPQEERYLYVRGCKPNFISELLYDLITWKPIHMIVKPDQMDRTDANFYIKDGLSPKIFANVWIIDEAAYELMNDIAWKWTAEDLTEQQVNYSKHVAYLAPQLATSVAREEAKSNIESEKWERMKKQRYS